MKLPLSRTKSALIAATILVTVVLTAIPAMAQGPFEDVPHDHWAYTVVDQLKNAGLVEGYPGRSYGGSRPLTRYEFAMAIARLLNVNPNYPPDQPTSKDIKELREELKPNGKFATKEDVADLRRAFEAFRADFDQQQPGIDSLTKKLSGEIIDSLRQTQWEWFCQAQGIYASPYRPQRD